MAIVINLQNVAAARKAEFALVTNYELVWNDAGSGARQNLSVWKPVLPDGCKVLGHTAVNRHSKPDYGTLVIRPGADTDLVRAPVGFKKAWSQLRANRGPLHVWHPIAPEGFVSLGDITTVGDAKPSMEGLVCVSKSLVQGDVLKAQIWNDRGGGAPRDGALFEQPGSTGLFFCSDDGTHNRPAGMFCFPKSSHLLQVSDHPSSLPNCLACHVLVGFVE